MKMDSDRIGIVGGRHRPSNENRSFDHASGEQSHSRTSIPSEIAGKHLLIPWNNGDGPSRYVPFFYESDKTSRIIDTINQAADTDVTVVIQGESGVGKELVARTLHHRSGRRPMPFTKVNCAALPEQLLEAELFGYEKGAFTGAYRGKPGRFELAHRGTIFLDEITEVNLPVQAKLLQVLQDGEFSRVGGKGDVRVDVRVLVATNRNLEESVRTGRFREDLYYRLNVLRIDVPPLRERKEEIPFLTQYLLQKGSREYGKPVPTLSPEMNDLLMRYEWPGNVRELENMVKRLVVLGNESVIKKPLYQHFSTEPQQPQESKRQDEYIEGRQAVSLKEIGRKAALEAERQVILRTLYETRWNRRKAARLLGISYKALLYKIKQCEIDSNEKEISPTKL